MGSEDIEDLQGLDPFAFEDFVKRVFEGLGYQAEVTKRSGDEGVDLVLNKGDERSVAQCKRYRGQVGQSAVRDFYGTVIHEKAKRGFLVTTGTFSLPSQVWAEGENLVLVDGSDLVDSIHGMGIGVERPTVRGPSAPTMLTEAFGEGGEIIDAFLRWSKDMVAQYEPGVMPDMSGWVSALARWKDLAQRVESLNVPAAFQESQGLWLAANSKVATGMEMIIAGMERTDGDLGDQGNAHLGEGTRLLSECAAALDRGIKVERAAEIGPSSLTQLVEALAAARDDRWRRSRLKRDRYGLAVMFLGEPPEGHKYEELGEAICQVVEAKRYVFRRESLPVDECLALFGEPDWQAEGVLDRVRDARSLCFVDDIKDPSALSVLVILRSDWLHFACSDWTSGGLEGLLRKAIEEYGRAHALSYWWEDIAPSGVIEVPARYLDWNNLIGSLTGEVPASDD